MRRLLPPPGTIRSRRRPTAAGPAFDPIIYGGAGSEA